MAYLGRKRGTYLKQKLCDTVRKNVEGILSLGKTSDRKTFEVPSNTEVLDSVAWYYGSLSHSYVESIQHLYVCVCVFVYPDHSLLKILPVVILKGIERKVLVECKWTQNIMVLEVDL